MWSPSDFCPVAFKNIFHYALLISSVSQLLFAWWLNTNACLLRAESLAGFFCSPLKKKKNNEIKKMLYEHNKLQRFLVAHN